MMAPQQNSTLIEENLEMCPSLLNIPEEINKYSPILPPKNKENLFDNNENNKNNNRQHQDVNSISKLELREKEQRHYYKTKHYRNGSAQTGHSRRSRSISLQGVNSKVEQGHKEVTIWLGDEPRYISGVTNKTTCNDIIKALIEDEISNGNYKYCQQLKEGTSLRDYSVYVITERWRGIERSYDGNMAILPLWKAWSRVHNEVRLSLKHDKDVQDPTKALKFNTTLSFVRDYICKIMKFGKSKKCDMKSRKSKILTKPTEDGKELKSNDVRVFINPKAKSNQTKFFEETLSKIVENKVEGVSTKLANEDTEFKGKTKMNKEKLYKLSDSRSSIRKRRKTNERKTKNFPHDGRRGNTNDWEANNFLHKRKDSCVRNSVRNKLAQKHAEMNDLYEREYALTRELANKCKMYKRHNELYTRCDRNLEMSIGQIQRNIETCAKDIIKTEHELLEVKNYIKHDISIIYNLKRLTLDTDLTDVQNPLNRYQDIEPTLADKSQKFENSQKMLFVDNIYEFCDNNASMLV